MSDNSFDGQRFRQVWTELAGETRKAIQAKAAWECQSLSAVMREWWPEIWERITSDTKAVRE